MQSHEEQEPTVRIRDLRKDRVNFVLEHVDLACGYTRLTRIASPLTFLRSDSPILCEESCRLIFLPLVSGIIMINQDK